MLRLLNFFRQMIYNILVSAKCSDWNKSSKSVHNEIPANNSQARHIHLSFYNKDLLLKFTQQ